MFQKHITHRTAVVIITANEHTGPFNARLYVNNGETATLTTKQAKTLKGAEKQAHDMLTRHFNGR